MSQQSMRKIEILKSSTCNDSLNISNPIKVRTENTFISLSPHVEEIHTTATFHFKCELCKFESLSSHELQGHLLFIHNPSRQHTSKWEPKKFHICNKLFNDTVHLNNHMMELHSFSYKSDVCMRCAE